MNAPVSFVSLQSLVNHKVIAGTTDAQTRRPFQVCIPDKKIPTQLYFTINNQ